jgi:hypothetical protein
LKTFHNGECVDPRSYGLNSGSHKDGDICTDGHWDTINDHYVNGKCIGQKPTELKADENKDDGLGLLILIFPVLIIMTIFIISS